MNDFFDRLVSIARAASDLAIESKTLMSDYEKQLETMKAANELLVNEKKELSIKNAIMAAETIDYEHQIESLSIDVSTLRKEQSDFVKVSHIVAIEKENAKLRKEVMDMTLKLRSTANERQNQINQMISQSYDDQKDAQESPEDSVDEEGHAEVEVFEKKFNKVTYYVSNDEQLIIFKKLASGDIGEKMGYCTRDGNKLTATWTSSCT